MKWIAEQKVIVVVEADTEEEAKTIIKENELKCAKDKIKTIRQGQQSWIVPMDNYWISRLELNK